MTATTPSPSSVLVDLCSDNADAIIGSTEYRNAWKSLLRRAALGDCIELELWGHFPKKDSIMCRVAPKEETATDHDPASALRFVVSSKDDSTIHHQFPTAVQTLFGNHYHNIALKLVALNGMTATDMLHVLESYALPTVHLTVPATAAGGPPTTNREDCSVPTSPATKSPSTTRRPASLEESAVMTLRTETDDGESLIRATSCSSPASPNSKKKRTSKQKSNHVDPNAIDGAASPPKTVSKLARQLSVFSTDDLGVVMEEDDDGHDSPQSLRERLASPATSIAALHLQPQRGAQQFLKIAGTDCCLTATQGVLFPKLLKQSIRVAASVPSNSGVSTAIALSVLHDIDFSITTPQAIVLQPTREAASSFMDTLKRYSSALPTREGLYGLFIGGSSVASNVKKLREPCRIVVGTPGRVEEMIGRDASPFCKDHVKALYVEWCNLMEIHCVLDHPSHNIYKALTTEDGDEDNGHPAPLTKLVLVANELFVSKQSPTMSSIYSAFGDIDEFVTLSSDVGLTLSRPISTSPTVKRALLPPTKHYYVHVARDKDFLETVLDLYSTFDIIGSGVKSLICPRGITDMSDIHDGLVDVLHAKGRPVTKVVDNYCLQLGQQSFSYTTPEIAAVHSQMLADDRLSILKRYFKKKRGDDGPSVLICGPHTLIGQQCKDLQLIFNYDTNPSKYLLEMSRVTRERGQHTAMVTLFGGGHGRLQCFTEFFKKELNIELEELDMDFMKPLLGGDISSSFASSSPLLSDIPTVPSPPPQSPTVRKQPTLFKCIAPTTASFGDFQSSMSRFNMMEWEDNYNRRCQQKNTTITWTSSSNWVDEWEPGHSAVNNDDHEWGVSDTAAEVAWGDDEPPANATQGQDDDQPETEETKEWKPPKTVEDPLPWSTARENQPAATDGSDDEEAEEHQVAKNFVVDKLLGIFNRGTSSSAAAEAATTKRSPVRVVHEKEGEYRPIITFDDSPINHSLNVLRGIYAYGFEFPTVVQRELIPAIGTARDILCQGVAGSGKTGAYVAGVLLAIDWTTADTTQVIVACPSRELASQICNVTTDLSEYVEGTKSTSPANSTLVRNACTVVRAFIGGNRVGDDIRTLQNGCTIAIGTLGRLVDLISRGALRTEHVSILLLDEADELLSSHHQDNLYDLFTHCNKDVQVVLVDRVFRKEAITLSERFMRDPIRIGFGASTALPEGLQHFLVPNLLPTFTNEELSAFAPTSSDEDDDTADDSDCEADDASNSSSTDYALLMPSGDKHRQWEGARSRRKGRPGVRWEERQKRQLRSHYIEMCSDEEPVSSESSDDENVGRHRNLGAEEYRKNLYLWGEENDPCCMRHETLHRLLCDLLEEEEDGQILLFCTSRKQCENLAAKIRGGYLAKDKQLQRRANQGLLPLPAGHEKLKNGIPCSTLHADLPQHERKMVLDEFRAGSCRFLITCGDTMRGLDIHHVDTVIIFDFPRLAVPVSKERKEMAFPIPHQEFEEIKDATRLFNTHPSHLPNSGLGDVSSAGLQYLWQATRCARMSKRGRVFSFHEGRGSNLGYIASVQEDDLLRRSIQHLEASLGVVFDDETYNYNIKNIHEDHCCGDDDEGTTWLTDELN